jgi:hypothetical protein
LGKPSADGLGRSVQSRSNGQLRVYLFIRTGLSRDGGLAENVMGEESVDGPSPGGLLVGTLLFADGLTGATTGLEGKKTGAYGAEQQ